VEKHSLAAALSVAQVQRIHPQIAQISQMRMRCLQEAIPFLSYLRVLRHLWMNSLRRRDVPMCSS